MMFVFFSCSMKDSSASASVDDDYDEEESIDSGYSSQQTHSQTSNIGSSLLQSTCTHSLLTTDVHMQQESSHPTNDLSMAAATEQPVVAVVAATEQPVVEQPPAKEPDQGSLSAGEAAEEVSIFLPEGISSIAELRAKVKELFPDFKSDSNLRFLSMLGSGRASSGSYLWKGAKKRKKGSTQISSVCDPDSWTFNFGPEPTADMLIDDEEAFLTPVISAQPTAVNSSRGEVDPETSEWRFGPAKVWYDMVSAPEDGRGFSYGFKLKVSHNGSA